MSHTTKPGAARPQTKISRFDLTCVPFFMLLFQVLTRLKRQTHWGALVSISQKFVGDAPALEG